VNGLWRGYNASRISTSAGTLFTRPSFVVSRLDTNTRNRIFPLVTAWTPAAAGAENAGAGSTVDDLTDSLDYIASLIFCHVPQKATVIFAHHLTTWPDLGPR
jgi:hypothetical protein